MIHRRKHTEDGKYVDNGIPKHYDDFEGFKVGEVINIVVIVGGFRLINELVPVARD